MTLVSGDPYPKSRQLARGERRYRRKVASPKQWQAIIAAKLSRQRGGNDTADNIVPLHLVCHARVTYREPLACERLLSNLTDAEYAYAIGKGGEDYFERAYGLSCKRAV